MEPMDRTQQFHICSKNHRGSLSAEAPLVQAVKELGGSPLGAGLVRLELNDIICG